MRDFRSFFLGNHYIMSLWEKSRPFYRKFFPYASLNSLDKNFEMHLPVNGIFMEAGANDGLNQSNTLFLARVHGWKGILVEPVPRLFERLGKNRPESFCINAALVAPEDSGTIIDLIDVDLMTSVRNTKNFTFDETHIRTAELVQGISRTSASTTGKTISEVITESGFPGIDFLSLDVEGFEIEALKGFTEEKHFPIFMLIETKQLELVFEVLNHRYELVEKLSEHDYFLKLKPST
jgi:FkbM family methyltransferase